MLAHKPPGAKSGDETYPNRYVFLGEWPASMVRRLDMTGETVDISEKLLEAIQFEKKIGPEHLDISHSVDAYIKEFCDW